MSSPNNSLIRVLGQYGLTLPKNAIEWRVVYDPEGGAGRKGEHILHGLVTELITDGIVSWFLLGDHETLFFGHHSNFVETKEQAEPKSRALSAFNQSLIDKD